MTGRIVNVRGTNGSGKSYIVHRILDAHPNRTITGEFHLEKAREHQPGERTLGYRMRVPGLALPLHVVGAYRTACGGCDGIRDHDEIQSIVRRFAADGHVLFEGLLITNSRERWAKMADEEYPGGRMVLAFLDTPAEVCIQRVTARRRERHAARHGPPQAGLFGGGDGPGPEGPKPLNPGHLLRVHKTHKRTRRVLGERGTALVDLDHRADPPEGPVMALFHEWEAGQR